MYTAALANGTPAIQQRIDNKEAPRCWRLPTRDNFSVALADKMPPYSHWLQFVYVLGSDRRTLRGLEVRLRLETQLAGARRP